MKHQNVSYQTSAPVDMAVSIIVQSAILREGLNKLLSDAGLSVRSTISEIETDEILAAVRDDSPDLIIIDGNLCQSSSTLMIALGEIMPESRIVILTDPASMSRIAYKAIIAADAILSSELSPEEIIQSLRLVQLGSQVVSPNLSDLSRVKSDALRELSVVRATESVDAARDSLSPREIEILRYLLNGSSNKAIARFIGITEATVKVHVKGVLRKIRAVNRTQAAIWAVNNGIGHTAAPSVTRSAAA